MEESTARYAGRHADRAALSTWAETRGLRCRVLCDLPGLENYRRPRGERPEITIFSDSSTAIDRIRSDRMGPGQRFAAARHEVCSCIVGRGSTVTIRWAPAHLGVEGNEEAGTWAKAAAEGSSYESDRAHPREMSLSHTTRETTKTKSRARGTGFLAT